MNLIKSLNRLRKPLLINSNVHLNSALIFNKELMFLKYVSRQGYIKSIRMCMNLSANLIFLLLQSSRVLKIEALSTTQYLLSRKSKNLQEQIWIY